jgi:hypothetical protein
MVTPMMSQVPVNPMMSQVPVNPMTQQQPVNTMTTQQQFMSGHQQMNHPSMSKLTPSEETYVELYDICFAMNHLSMSKFAPSEVNLYLPLSVDDQT